MHAQHQFDCNIDISTCTGSLFCMNKKKNDILHLYSHCFYVGMTLGALSVVWGVGTSLYADC